MQQKAEGTEGSLRSYLWKHFPPHCWVESKKSQTEETEKWTDTEMMHHFFTQYGVNIHIEASIFYLFKYEMTIADNWQDEIKEARGIIFHRVGGENADWEISSRPFDKFFNQQEGECPVAEKRVFEEHCADFSFVEKADGTCVQFWWCPTSVIDDVFESLTLRQQKELERKKERELNEKEEEKDKETAPTDAAPSCLVSEEAKGETTSEKQASKLEKRNRRFQQKTEKKEKKREDATNKLASPTESHNPLATETDVREVVRKPRNHNGWRVSTLGMITTAPVFEDAFWNLLCREESVLEVIDNHFDKSKTYLFELCCEVNRVVTRYKQDSLFLIGARDRTSGDVLPKLHLDELAEKLGKGAIRPHHYTFNSLGITTLKGALDWVENEAKTPNIYGEVPEGFVVYWKGEPVAKMKNKFYSDKHQLITGNLLSNRNIAIDRYFGGTIDDVMDVLPEPIHRFLKELRGKVKNLIAEVESLRSEFVKTLPKECLDPSSGQAARLYADAAKKGLDPKHSGFFFQYRDELLQPFILDGNEGNAPSIEYLYLKWLTKNYFKFHSLWKDTQVEEILAEERLQAKGKIHNNQKNNKKGNNKKKEEK